MVPPKHQWFAKRPLKSMLIKFISISNLWSISRSFHKSPCSFDPSKTYSALFVVCVALLLPLSLMREYCSCFIKIIFSQSTSTQPLPAYISLPHIDWPLARPIASQTAGMASASSEVWIYKRKTDLKWNWLVFEADSVVDSMVSYFFLGCVYCREHGFMPTFFLCEFPAQLWILLTHKWQDVQARSRAE